VEVIRTASNRFLNVPYITRVSRILENMIR